jgi:hypothetical protein
MERSQMPRGVPKKRTMYVCTTTFMSAFGDARAGDRFAEGHEMVKKNPQYFQPIQVDAPEVEAATAAPGEERGDDSG